MSGGQSQTQSRTTKRLFSRETSVAIEIAAEPEIVWKLLTDTERFPAWTNTVLEIVGKIAPGEQIQLRSQLAPKRVFKLKVKEFERPSRLSWGDAMGTRVFTLSKVGDQATRFTMTERIGGPIFPLFAALIPSFDESFNQFAADIKKAAEELK